MTANPKKNTKPAKTRHTGRLVIIAAVIALLAAAGYLLNKRARAEQTASPEQTQPQKRIAVVTTPAATRDFQHTLVVQGTVEAKNFAMVSPRIPGILEAIFADEGDVVTGGETRLFQTDAANLKENVEIGRHNLTVAQCAKRQAAASLEKTRADLHKAQLDYERFKRLFEKEATTANALEQQESQYLQLQAAEKLNAAQVDLAAAQEDQAEAALAIAQKNLTDATIYAPISGKVSQRLLEPGEMGSPGMPVLRIDDTSLVEVAAFLPAQYYTAVVPGQTTMRIGVSAIDVGTQVITYKSPTIQPRLRTFEIKCVLPDPPEGVTAGAMAQIVVVLESRSGIGVPSAALQLRGGRSVVFVIENNIAREVPVETGIESDGWIEISSGDLKEAAAVVTMGQYMVEAGTPVSVQQEVR